MSKNPKPLSKTELEQLADKVYRLLKQDARLNQHRANPAPRRP